MKWTLFLSEFCRAIYSQWIQLVEWVIGASILPGNCHWLLLFLVVNHTVMDAANESKAYSCSDNKVICLVSLLCASHWVTSLSKLTGWGLSISVNFSKMVYLFPKSITISVLLIEIKLSLYLSYCYQSVDL